VHTGYVSYMKKWVGAPLPVGCTAAMYDVSYREEWVDVDTPPCKRRAVLSQCSVRWMAYTVYVCALADGVPARGAQALCRRGGCSPSGPSFDGPPPAT
jgi:hypothetical protein